LIAGRLIRQMNGLSGCRIFKISGVRELIRQFQPHQYFVHQYAMKCIAPQFAQKYRHLSIGRGSEDLTPQDVFDELVERGLFRAGLALLCPVCSLKFWSILDDLKTSVSCTFCGSDFNISKQLLNSRWSYRPSGLLATGEHQQGAIPVVLTLQHLSFMSWNFNGPSLVNTAMELSSQNGSFSDCESDFVVLGQDHNDKLFLVIGECKERGEITGDDVSKMTNLANALACDRLLVYILFSKLAPFSEDETARCRGAQGSDYMRVIMLTDVELDTDQLLTHYPKESGIGPPIDLNDMVAATSVLFFKDVSNAEMLQRGMKDNLYRLPRLQTSDP
jgi:hypothetical protein